MKKLLLEALILAIFFLGCGERRPPPELVEPEFPTAEFEVTFPTVGSVDFKCVSGVVSIIQANHQVVEFLSYNNIQGNKKLLFRVKRDADDQQVTIEGFLLNDVTIEMYKRCLVEGCEDEVVSKIEKSLIKSNGLETDKPEPEIELEELTVSVFQKGLDTTETLEKGEAE